MSAIPVAHSVAGDLFKMTHNPHKLGAWNDVAWWL